MENIFIVLAIIASFVYKFYENYKKEMEEAAKRQQKTRRMSTTPDDSNSIPPTPSSPAPTVQLPTRPAIPAPEIRQQPTPHKTLSPHTNLRVESVNSPDASYTASSREERKSLKALQVIIDDKEDNISQGDNQCEVAFDLKTAIIQSAILERPYR